MVVLIDDPDDGVPQSHALFLGEGKLREQVFVSPYEFVYLSSVVVLVSTDSQKLVSEGLLVALQIT